MTNYKRKLEKIEKSIKVDREFNISDLDLSQISITEKEIENFFKKIEDEKLEKYLEKLTLKELIDFYKKFIIQI